MNIFLFSFDIKLAFLFAFLFLFVVPIFLIKANKVRLSKIYLLLFFFLLIPGVLLNVEINSKYISFSWLYTQNWATNTPSIAFFDPLMIIINILLLFPLGVIAPILVKNDKKAFLKIIFLGFLTSFSIELLQFLLPIRRYPELLDIINNVISVILGYEYYIIVKLLSRGENYDKLPQQKDYKYQKRVYKLWQKRNEP